MKLKFLFKHRYHYHPETLSFIKEEINVLEVFLRRFFRQVPISLGIGITLFLVGYKYFETPRQKNLLNQKKDLVLKYELLNKRLEQMTNALAEIQNRDDFIYRPIFEAQPVPSSIRNAGIGGVDRYKDLEGFKSSDLLVNTAKKVDQLSMQLYVQSKSNDDIVKMIKDKTKMMSCIPAIQPISNKTLTRLGSLYGWRFHPILHYVRMHYGIDLTAPTGVKVYAAGDGVVKRSEYSGNGFGNNVIIDHGYSYETVYAHLSKNLVKEGQKVKRGDIIGLVGGTGLATCPHLHYEVHKGGKPVDPLNYIYNDMSNEEYEKMVENAKNSDTHSWE